MSGTQQPEDLPAAEALRLLGDVRFGRVVFTSRALPAVRPVRHVVADGTIVISAGPELPLSPASVESAHGGGTIVAYEADQLDSSGCSGWTVVVIGRARPVTDTAEIGRYRRLLPSVSETDQLITISADVVTGFRTVGSVRPAHASG
jgi:hypothetical protein